MSLCSGFEFGEKSRSFLCAACSPHEAAALARLELADVRSRVAKGQQVGGGERFRVTLVEIQSVNHRRAFQHDSHTCLAVAAELAVALCRIESRGNGTHDFHMPANQGQFLSHAIETTISPQCNNRAQPHSPTTTSQQCSCSWPPPRWAQPGVRDK